MNFGEILKKSYQLTKKNKILWLLGMLITSGTYFNFYGSGGGFNYDLDDTDINYDFSALLDYWYIIALIILLIFIIAVIVIVLSIIAKAGLLHGVNQAISKKRVSFGKSFKYGLTKFWRVLSIELLLGLLITAVVLVIILPGILLLLIPIIGWILGILLIIFGCLAAIFLGLVIALISNYILCYAVIQDKKIMEAIKAGWQLFKKNLGDTIIMGLILFGVGVGCAIAILLAIIAMLFVFGGIGFLGFLTLNWVGVAIVIFIVLLVLAVLGLLAKGILNTFSFSCWVYTWRALIDKK